MQEMATGDPRKLPRKGVWLYHVTYFGRLKAILRAGGLAPGHSMGSTFGSQYANWSRGKVFVARSNRAFFWYGRVGAWAEHSGPEFPDLGEEDGDWHGSYEDHDDAEEAWKSGNRDWTVVVLRYRDHGRHSWSPDYKEDHEHSDDHYWTERNKKVPAKLISMWDPYDGEWFTRLDGGTIEELGESIDNLLDEALDLDPSGFTYDYTPNSHKLHRGLDEALGDPKLGKALKKVGFRSMGQAKRAARIRKSQVKIDKLPPKYRKKLLDPRRKDLLLDKRKRVEEAALTDIQGVKAIYDTADSKDGRDRFGNAAAERNGYLLGWHVTDDPKTITDILNKRVPPQKAGGKSGDMGAGFYVSAVPRVWVNRSGGKWDFLDHIDGRQLTALIDKLEGEILSGPAPQRDKGYAVRDIKHVRNGLLNPPFLSRYAGLPFGVQFWRESWLKPLGISSDVKPLSVRVEIRGRFAQMSQSAYTHKAARLLKRAGVSGAFVRGGFSDTAQMVIWDPKAISKVGRPEVVEARISEARFFVKVEHPDGYMVWRPRDTQYSRYIPMSEWTKVQADMMTAVNKAGGARRRAVMSAESVDESRVPQKYWDALDNPEEPAKDPTDSRWFWIINLSMDLEDELKQGKVSAREAGRWATAAIKASKVMARVSGDRFTDADDIVSLTRRVSMELALEPMLKRLRGKRSAHLKIKKTAPVQHFVVHPSTRAGYTIQISEFDKDMKPWGHRDRRGTLEDALREVWETDGPFELLDVSESALGEGDDDPFKRIQLDMRAKKARVTKATDVLMRKIGNAKTVRLGYRTRHGDESTIVHIATRGDAPPGKPWQATSFDDRGPYQHYNFASVRDAVFDVVTRHEDAKVLRNESVSEAFEYGLRLRPPGPGAVPKGFIKIGKHPRFRHGTVIYAQELSAADVRNFELEPLFAKAGRGGELLALPRSTNLRELRDFAIKVSRALPTMKADVFALFKDAKEDVADGDDEREIAEFAHRGIVSRIETSESIDEGVTLEEKIAAQARTTFDAAPYANMALLDVARLLRGAVSQAQPNIQVVEKLVDRLIHALEFTIYSVQGRPEGRRIGNLIRGSFNALTQRLPELALEDRQRAISAVATLSESLEDLELGPAAPSARS